MRTDDLEPRGRTTCQMNLHITADEERPGVALLLHFAPSESKHAGMASCALFQPLAGTGLGFPAW